MTAEVLIRELEALAPAERRKFFAYLATNAAKPAFAPPAPPDEEGTTDVEFNAGPRKIIDENRELLRRLKPT